MRHLGPGGLGPRWHDWAGVREEGASIQSLTSWFLAGTSHIFLIFQHNSSKSAPKSIPNRPKRCPGALRNRSWTQVGSRNGPGVGGAPSKFWTTFGALWQIVRAILDPLNVEGPIRLVFLTISRAVA